MLKEKVQEQLNQQINAELYSAYLYQSMGAYFEASDLDGFANWMDIQAQEEMGHARRIYDFVNERGGRVKLEGIDSPPLEWDNPLTAFEDAYAHEQKITGMINELVDTALESKDHATNSFLQWFVDEQVEEEDSVNTIVQKLKIIGDSGSGLFMLNNEMGQRVVVVDGSADQAE